MHMLMFIYVMLLFKIILANQYVSYALIQDCILTNNKLHYYNVVYY